MPPPSTDLEISDLYFDLRYNYSPPFPGFQYGFLYGTESRERRTVAVPINHGVGKLTSINQLRVHSWVPNTSGSGNVVNMAVGRVKVTRLMAMPLEYAYTIIYVPPTTAASTPVNTCPVLKDEPEWHGNILVVKHGKKKVVINVDPEDGRLVDLMIRTHIRYGLLV
ncbi:hypothetical protein DFH06DRAFT_1134974 [Mycena polygramma]|nr:hypothetical protein DFH06DRAFT_1134974 [Mycena polygramma]